MRPATHGVRTIRNRGSKIPKPRKQVSPIRLTSWPLPLVLHVILADLESLLAQSNEDLVTDGSPGLRIAATELLHNVFWDFSGQGCLEGSSSGGRLDLRYPRRKCIGINDTDASLADAPKDRVMGLKLRRGLEPGIIDRCTLRGCPANSR